MDEVSTEKETDEPKDDKLVINGELKTFSVADFCLSESVTSVDDILIAALYSLYNSLRIYLIF